MSNTYPKKTLKKQEITCSVFLTDFVELDMMLADARDHEGVVRQSVEHHELYVARCLGVEGPATDVSTAARDEGRGLHQPEGT